MVINESLNINTCKVKKNITYLLENIIEENLLYFDINGKDILNQKQKERIKNNIIKDFNQNINYKLYLSIEKNYCIHKFNKGINFGKYCNRKIYIKDGENIQYYCSRHNKTYNVIPRNYEKRKRCEYVRDNGLQCKNHTKYNNFCYVHKHHNIKIDPFLKLNKLRELYYKNIKKKRKKHINNYFKQNNYKKDKKPKLVTDNQNVFHKNDKSHNFHHIQNMNHFNNISNLYVKELNSNGFKLQNVFKIKKKKKIKKKSSCRW